MSKYRTIKKYKNRRLYDLEISQFITIDDLQRYVINGVLFHVLDASSEKDITNATLLQIFVEMEANSTQFLSSDMLRQLIVMVHHPFNRAFISLLEQMMLSMNNQSSQSAFSTDYQKPTTLWSEQTQAFLKQWKTMF